MNREFAKTYQPADFEQRIYQQWLQSDAFVPGPQADTYTIVIPPPNVTGVLHMGHGLNGVLQDILVRYERMQQKATLWLPGTDHAGIATQHIVEKRLRTQGQSRKKLGREAFLSATWQVKEEHHATISRQFQRLGASVDWGRERFTMDAGLSQAVREVFVRLYEQGLVYRGEYLVNWCPSCTTALADDEVEHREEHGQLYQLLYPFAAPEDELRLSADGQETIHRGIVVATTRPETLFGDEAVAVHPEDPRYRELIGKHVCLPLTGRQIPIIADSFCDMEFGSGAVKITPAHDPNDWQAAQRHGLALRNILQPDGSLNETVPAAFCGLDCRQARKAVLAALKEAGLLLRSSPHRHQIGHCYRCGSVMEPFVSEQWFVRMKPLADKALAALERGEIRFYPQRWANTYRHWLGQIRDWCISRQLWWGHRIPAWHCAACGQISVSREEPAQCQHCASTDIAQDEDVLDTWFSSWLWPFSTLGWPEQTADLARFYPTDTLVTGYDIIFFWVARMVMAGLHFTGQVPFGDIYITPLVRDVQGRKMSKSLGNGIDPLEVIEQYGADALKFTISYLSTQGQDLSLELDSFKLGSRFCNKIWNATRFLLLNLEQLYRDAATDERALPPVSKLRYQAADLWIWQRFAAALRTVEQGRQSYRFDDMSQACYQFFWHDFCDWYLEAAKLELGAQNTTPHQLAAAAKLIEVLEASLRLLHPFVSFLSEELYARLPPAYRCASLIDAPYPQSAESQQNQAGGKYSASPELLQHFAQLQELVTSVRTLRSEFCLPPNQCIAICFDQSQQTAEEGGFAAFLATQRRWVESLCRAELVQRAESGPYRASEAIGSPLQQGQVLLFVRTLIDLEREQQRLRRRIAKEEKLVHALQGKLGKASFRSRAPKELVAAEERKLGVLETSLQRSRQFLAQLDGQENGK